MPTPQYVANQWNSFAAEVLPKEASVHQRQWMRRAFYSGATVVMFEILKTLDKPDSEAEAILQALSEELARYGERVEAGVE